MGRGYEGRKSVKRDSEHRLEGGRGRGAQVRRGGAERVPVQNVFVISPQHIWVIKENITVL